MNWKKLFTFVLVLPALLDAGEPTLTNRPPAVNCSRDITTCPNRQVTVKAQIVDPDGDSLTIQWEVAGPGIKVLSPSFTSKGTSFELNYVFVELGVYSITLIASDGVNASTVCPTIVRVVDLEPITTFCPPTIVSNVLGRECVVFYAPPEVKNGMLVSCTPPSGSIFPEGTTQVTCIATNVCMTNICTFNVTVRDSSPAPTLPKITQQPKSQSVPAGRNLLLAVVAEGTEPLTYDWFLGGKHINYGTLPTLQLDDVQLEDAGSYTVVVSNPVARVSSAIALLEVLEGNNRFNFNTDSFVGNVTNAESGSVEGGFDTLDFSATRAMPIFVDLSATGSQVVNSNMTLTLLSDSSIEALVGGNKNDVLLGNGLNNTLEGGPGNDHLEGKQGDDTYRFNTDFDLGTDLVVEAPGVSGGIDTLDFSKSTLQGITIDLGNLAAQNINSNLVLTLSNRDAIENVKGGASDDILLGNLLSNIISGGPGDDVLIGGGGEDTLIGGPGNDRYVFFEDWGQDTVFESPGGGADLLDFSGIATALTVKISTNLSITSHTSAVLSNGADIETILGGEGDDLFYVEGDLLDGMSLDGGGGLNHLTFDARGRFVYLSPSTVGLENGPLVHFSRFNEVNIINPLLGEPPQIVGNIVTETQETSLAVSFTVISKGTPPLSYQWLENGQVLSGETNASLKVSSFSSGESPIYEVVVANRSGAATSGVATLPRNSSSERGLVVINEVLAHDDRRTGFVELYAPAEAVDLTRWSLSDDLQKPAKFRIPENTRIAANGFLVLEERDLGFPLLPEGGEVFLFSGDRFGNPTILAYRFSFGAAEPGVSFGRYPTQTGEELILAQKALTPGKANEGPKLGPLIINEVMFSTPPGTSRDFIEISNIATNSVELSKEGSTGALWHLSGDVEFTFRTNLIIPPGRSIVLVGFDPSTNLNETLAFQRNYGLAAEVPLLGPYIGHPNEAGYTLELWSPTQLATAGVGSSSSFILVDSIAYTESSPWPTDARTLGASLQRRAPEEYGNDPGNWVIAKPSPGIFLPPVEPPVISIQPSDRVVKLGETAVFAASIRGTQPIAYQWFRDGKVINGANSLSYELLFVTPSNEGSYSLVLSNAAGQVVSRGAYLRLLSTAAEAAFGLKHSIIGPGTLVLEGTNLLVLNAPAKNETGVSVRLDGVGGLSFKLEPISLATPQQSLRLGASGMDPLSSGIGPIELTNVNHELQVNIREAPPGVSNVLVRMYLDGQIVGTALSIIPGLVGFISQKETSLPEIVGVSLQSAQNGAPATVGISFSGPAAFVPSGGQPVSVNRLVLESTSATGSQTFEAINLSGVDLPGLRILNESVENARPLISIVRQGEVTVVSWAGTNFLVEASRLLEGTNQVLGAKSPYVVPPTLQQAFFWLSSTGPDSDGDGLPDDWESAYGLDPMDPRDGVSDADGDGLGNIAEFYRGTHPKDAQSGRANIYVDSTWGRDDYDGLAPFVNVAKNHGPKRHIQSAILSANRYDALIVAPGIYPEHLVFTNNLTPVSAAKAVIGLIP
jgi:hypothetical protein